MRRVNESTTTAERWKVYHHRITLLAGKKVTQGAIVTRSL